MRGMPASNCNSTVPGPAAMPAVHRIMPAHRAPGEAAGDLRTRIAGSGSVGDRGRTLMLCSLLAAHAPARPAGTSADRTVRVDPLPLQLLWHWVRLSQPRCSSEGSARRGRGLEAPDGSFPMPLPLRAAEGRPQLREKAEAASCMQNARGQAYADIRVHQTDRDRLCLKSQVCSCGARDAHTRPGRWRRPSRSWMRRGLGTRRSTWDPSPSC